MPKVLMRKGVKEATDAMHIVLEGKAAEWKGTTNPVLNPLILFSLHSTHSTTLVRSKIVPLLLIFSLLLILSLILTLTLIGQI